MFKFRWTTTNSSKEHRNIFRDARVPYNNLVFSEDKNLAAFVLLNEISTTSGLNIREGIYVLKKEDEKVRGKLLEYNSNAGHYDKNMRYNKYFRYLVNKIEDKVLKYTVIDGKEKNELEFNFTNF